MSLRNYLSNGRSTEIGKQSPQVKYLKITIHFDVLSYGFVA